MTVRIHLVAAALVLLAACGKPAQPPAEEPAPAAVPSPGVAKVEPTETALVLRAEGATLGDADVGRELSELGFELPTDLTSVNLRETLRSPVEHRVETQTKEDEAVVADATTRLMWQATGSYKHSSSGLVKAAEVTGYIGDLNAKKLAGYSDWRLPTLAELASVIDTEKRDRSWSLLPGFDLGAPWFVLTSDKVKGDASVVWTIDVGGGDLLKYSASDEYYLLLVRSIE